MISRTIFSLLFLCCAIGLSAQFQFTIEEMNSLPESVSNNAVCEGFQNEVPYVYSFGGIDSTLDQSGIHQRSWRYNTILDSWETLDSLPDAQAKIAAAASRVDEIIYIMGGYYVAPNGNETSSKKVHRFSTQSNSFLSDGQDIPVAIDDHVQAVWRDSLIYLISGWSNTTNVPNVQIYDPVNNSWQVGTAVPNNNLFKTFGSSGTIIGDTIYYHGGAAIGPSFPATFQVRKGVIEFNDPTQITWSLDTLSTDLFGYRSACTSINDTLFWMGGSSVTYNYDAIAYNGSGVVAPNNRIIMSNTSIDFDTSSYKLPMDLRGVAKTSENEFYLVGGIGENADQSNKLLKFIWRKEDLVGIRESSDFGIKTYPIPFRDYLQLDVGTNANARIFNVQGEIVYELMLEGNKKIETSLFPAGVYFLNLGLNGQEITVKIFKD